MDAASDPPGAAATGIVATGLRRSFGKVEAVRDVSLHARAGAVTGLVGPNGSGKTTLFLMLASLLTPDAGTIRIGDVDPIERPHAARALLGWMPDSLGTWGALSARETLIVTGRLHDLPKDAARARADELLELVAVLRQNIGAKCLTHITQWLLRLFGNRFRLCIFL